VLGAPVNVALTIAAISVVILVHELGHFIAAKAVGMRVEIFSIGFWKKILCVKVGDTEYRLSLVPFGGYVKVSGESPEQGGGKPHEFWSKTPGQRAFFIVGGVMMNLVLALVLFIAAFAIGVPFTVAEVGRTSVGGAAWKAGLKPGDRIVAMGEKADPVFQDLRRSVALGGSDDVDLTVRRDGREITFELEPTYDKRIGMKMIGLEPPIEPVVTGLARLGKDGRCPAQEAGIRIGDRILAINGVQVQTAQELYLELANYPHDPVELLVQRNGRTLPFLVVTEPTPHYLIGISALTSTIKSVEGAGMAEKLGLRVGDQVIAVNRRPVRSAVEIEMAVRDALGETTLQVLRDGRELTFTLRIPDLRTLDEFQHSMAFASGTTLAWVREGGPAWDVGLRPGDSVVRVAGREVNSWEDILVAGASAGREAHEIQWTRGSELLKARVKPVKDTSMSAGHLGVLMELHRSTVRRYSAVGAIGTGLLNTLQTLEDLFLTLRGFARREVSPSQMGGIILIAQASYHAAKRGIGMLLYMTALISAAIAYLNILPIPVLDGGHLLFLAIEKVRGRRLGERALTVAQTVGLVLLVLLMVYATRNDILRIFNH